MNQLLIRLTGAALAWCWPALCQTISRTPATPHVQCDAGETLIVETVSLNGVTPPRLMALWMCQVEKHEDEVIDHVYTCPDQTRGHYYRGRTWLSLIDATTGLPINTIPIRSDWENEDTFDIPYRIARRYYAVDGPTDKHDEGKPTILSLKDYNGDGEALEFALFEVENCTLVKTSLFGYSKAKDRAIQYPIHLIQTEGTGVTIRDSPWLDHFMLQKPIRPGVWKWEYQYHVGGLTHFDIHYDPAREAFEGQVKIDPAR